jgi:cell division protein FtsB
MARRRKNSHRREIYYILGILFVIAFGLLSFLGPNGYIELRRARLELQNRQNRVQALKRENEEHTRSIQGLKQDREMLERYAREKGYGKQGELIQQVPDNAPDTVPGK